MQSEHGNSLDNMAPINLIDVYSSRVTNRVTKAIGLLADALSSCNQGDHQAFEAAHACVLTALDLIAKAGADVMCASIAAQRAEEATDRKLGITPRPVPASVQQQRAEVVAKVAGDIRRDLGIDIGGDVDDDGMPKAGNPYTAGKGGATRGE